MNGPMTPQELPFSRLMLWYVDGILRLSVGRDDAEMRYRSRHVLYQGELSIIALPRN